MPGPAGCAILRRMRSLFHFAFNVTDLDMARRFYGGVLGCTEGPPVSYTHLTLPTSDLV